MKTGEDTHSLLNDAEESVISKVETRLSVGLTVQRLGLETGIDAADINSLLKRERLDDYWKGKRGETAAAIATLTEWLGGETDTAQTQNEFAVTPTFQSLQSLFAHAHKKRKLLAVTGGVGIGKSESAKAYVKSHPRGYRKPGALRIEFAESDRKPAAAYSKILGALRGEVGHAYRNGNLHDAIGAALNPGDCLILDECNYLSEAMDVVRSIYDDFGIAIVMIGNPEFKETIWGKKSRYSALANRADRFEFPANTAEDVEAWLAWNGALAGMNTATRTKLIDRAVCVGTRPTRSGGLRALARGFDLCASVYAGTPLDGALLEQVIAQTNGAQQ